MSILPPNVNFEPITIYNKLPNGSYKRTVLQALWFTSTNKAIYSKGALPLDAVSIYVFDFEKYQDPYTEGPLRPTNWTVGISDNKVETVIFRGVVNFSNDRDLIKAIDNSKLSYKPKALKDNRKGLRSQQHLVIIC